MDFYIATSGARVKPGSIFVDSYLSGAALVLDHHVTGEITNIDLIFNTPTLHLENYQHIAATHIDSDSILSATALYHGVDQLSAIQKSVMAEAGLWCDCLISDPQKEYCESGMMLHYYLKKRGREIMAACACGMVDDEKKSFTFSELIRDTLEMIRVNVFKEDRSYLVDIEQMKERAGRLIVMCNSHVTVFQTSEHLDPAATYALHDSTCQVIFNPESNRYDVGIHPRHCSKGYDLHPLIGQLNAVEEKVRQSMEKVFESTWGGRKAAFGSPRFRQGEVSSVLPLSQVIDIVEKAIADQSHEETK